MKRHCMLVTLLVMPSMTGCALQEVRSKSKVGPEFRHRGSNRTNSVRWSAQQGFDFKWEQGIKTGVTYRRRDVDDGGGDNDNGVWFDVSFPVWQAKKKPGVTPDRIAEIERRLAELERRLSPEEGDAG